MESRIPLKVSKDLGSCSRDYRRELSGLEEETIGLREERTSLSDISSQRVFRSKD